MKAIGGGTSIVWESQRYQLRAEIAHAAWMEAVRAWTERGMLLEAARAQRNADRVK